MITLDTSATYELLDRLGPNHARARDALFADPGPWLVPAATLGEVAYLLESRHGALAMAGFLDDLADGIYALECGDEDIGRATELVRRYADLSLGFVNAAVIACAERNGGAVLTLDRRDFDVVAREGAIRVFP